MVRSSDVRIAVIGLGYVGLPLAVEFSKKYNVIGFDINASRVHELESGHDRTLEVADADLAATDSIIFTTNESELANANVLIVTAPTPVDEYKKPDLRPILAASASIARHMNVGDTVIYESTVYPGATEEQCVPVLEKVSGLKFNRDFTVGYSPERINPGDKEHRLPSITKVTSGSNSESAEFIDNLYRSIIEAGTHRAPSIKVAEAAKVIENTQRDVNIALVNELALLFAELGIDSHDVLEAAGTKWNFLKFTPGLVGGHCIGVDPYYLTHKAESVGFRPEMILAGRRINDGMGKHVATSMVKMLARQGFSSNGARVLILGLTFKENTPDLRNTRVVDIIQELEEFGICVDVFDPWVTNAEAKEHLSVEIIEKPEVNAYDGVILAVAHETFLQQDEGWIRGLLSSDKGVVYDLKSRLSRNFADARL